MNRKIYLKILLGIVTFVLLIFFLSTVIIEPWIGKKIQSALNEKNKDYLFEIKKVHILMFRSGIELGNITICSKQEHAGTRDLKGEIASIKFKGFKLVKALFKKDIEIREVSISNISVKGKIQFSGKAKPPIVSPYNIQIGKILFDKINLLIGSTSSAEFYSVKESVLKVYNLQIGKHDTIALGMVKQFDFKAKELQSVSSDSMYSYTANGIIYSATLNSLAVNSFSIHPNYQNYNFTSRYRYATDRTEARFANIYFHDFSASAFFKCRSMLCSYIEIGKMDVNDFIDLRKEFRHINKPAFQDIFYNYPEAINIDSICLIRGNIIYIEHAKDANKPGSISFNEINAKIYKISNALIYKTKSASSELKGEALLMGKSKMTILLKVKLFDRYNTFLLNGTLSGLEAKELNPILEKNAYIYVTSGKIDAMKFSFISNNSKSTGNMTLLYHGLDITVKNKRTDDTTAFKERLISLIANKKIINSNPIPGENVRVGIVDYKRDPERFLFNYCFKSILSGMTSSLTNNPKKKKIDK